MKTKILFSLLISVGITLPFKANSQSFSENFDDITTLAGNGWVLQNNSSPVGALSWFQGTPTTATPTPGPFNSYNGAVNSYIAANFNSTGSTGTISNWLITPIRTFKNGDVFTFYTRKPTIISGMTDYPDRLEVRLSTNGASTNVGVAGTGTGDFTTLLLSINPTLVANVYPQTWTQYTITISGLPAPTSGRIAFRYFVTGAGSLGSNSDYIGIDAVNYTPYVCPAITLTPGGALSNAIAGNMYSSSLTQTGALGLPNFAITSGSLPPGLVLTALGTISGTPTATGTYNFGVTVTDNSGCSGTQNYSILVECGNNPVSISNFPPICSNESPYTLSEGVPAGGTYSGTGVNGGLFDPSNGTQTITYNYVDPYGCSFSQNSSFAVNFAPNVQAGSDITVCDGQSVTLNASGALSYVWDNGVSDGVAFQPNVGTTQYTVTGTDANFCVGTSSLNVTVNSNPSVSFAAMPAFACIYGSDFTITGVSPAGGVFTGTGVNGTQFSPQSAGLGTHAVTYTFTDANGCSGLAVQNMVVDACLSVEEAANPFKLSIFPVPSSDFVNIKFDMEAGKDLNITLHTVDGKLVYSSKMISSSSNSLSLPVNQLASGVYYLNISDNDIRLSGKIIKQ